MLAFVEAGLGVALVPSMALVSRPLLQATPLAAPGVHRTIALANPRGAVLSHAARALRAMLLAQTVQTPGVRRVEALESPATEVRGRPG